MQLSIKATRDGEIKGQVVTNRRFNLGRQSHFIQEVNKRTLQIFFQYLDALFASQVSLHQLEEPHQLILLHEFEALIFKYGCSRVWHTPEVPLLIP